MFFILWALDNLFMNVLSFLGHIVLDVSLYNNADLLQSLYLKKLASKESSKVFQKIDARLKRFVLPIGVDSKVCYNWTFT